MNSYWTTRNLTAYDQALAGADAEVTILMQMMRTGISEAGEHQTMANIGKFLLERETPHGMAVLLTAALRRLANP